LGLAQWEHEISRESLAIALDGLHERPRPDSIQAGKNKTKHSRVASESSVISFTLWCPLHSGTIRLGRNIINRRYG
jgi:hypothetical protein